MGQRANHGGGEWGPVFKIRVSSPEESEGPKVIVILAPVGQRGLPTVGGKYLKDSVKHSGPHLPVPW